MKLNDSQLNRLSEIIGNLDLIFLSSVAIPALTRIGNIKIAQVYLGLLLMIVCAIISLVILRSIKYEHHS